MSRPGISAIAGTGHRPESVQALSDPLRLGDFRRAILAYVEQHGPGVVWHVGGARGFDTWLAVAAIELGRRIVLHLPFPFDTFTRRWFDPADVATLRRIAAYAHHVKTYTDRYHISGYHLRDHGMVDSAEQVFAGWDGRFSGGTWETIRYARSVGKLVVSIHPKSLLVEEMPEVAGGLV